MPFPTDTITKADVQVFEPTIWGQKINDIYRNKINLAKFFTDRSDEVSGGGDTIKTPGLSAMTAYTKTNGSAVTLSSPTETAINLVVNTWKHVAFSIEDLEAAQVKKSYNMQSRYASNAAYTMAKQLEVAIAALFPSFTTNVVGLVAGTANMSQVDINSALATATVLGMDLEEAAFIMHPNTFYRQVQALAIYNSAINSPTADPATKAPIAMLWGQPVIVSVDVPVTGAGNARCNLFAVPDAIHFATAALPTRNNSVVGTSNVRVTSSYVPEYQAEVVVADLAYGVVLNRQDAAILMYSHQTNV